MVGTHQEGILEQIQEEDPELAQELRIMTHQAKREQQRSSA